METTYQSNTNITKLIRTIFTAWFGCWLLSLVLYNIDYFQIMFWFNQYHNWSVWLWSIVQSEISSTKLLACLLIHSTSSLNCTNFTLQFNHIFTNIYIFEWSLFKLNSLNAINHIIIINVYLHIPHPFCSGKGGKSA